MTQHIKSQIISASRWSAMSEILSKAITPVTYLILAGLLSPLDFGIATIPLIVTAFCQILWDQGFSKAIIQQQDTVAEVINVAFWYNLALSTLAYTIVCVFAFPIAMLFKNPAAADVIRIQGVTIVITSIVSVYSAILLKSLDFRSLFFARVFPTFIIPAVAITMALYGYRYYSLVFGSIAGISVQCVTLVLFSKWKPALKFNVQVFKRALGFSMWSTSEGVLSWFYLWFDSLIIGFYLIPAELGLYRTGSLIINSLYAVSLSPIFPVLFASLAQNQSDEETFIKIFRNATRIITILALLIGGLLFSAGDLLTNVLLSSGWNGIGNVIMIFGLSSGLSWLISSNTEAFRAKGKVHIVVNIMLAGVFYYVPVYILSAQRGLEEFLWARLVLVIVTVPIYIYFSKKILSLPVLDIFLELKYVFVGTAALITFVSVLKRPQMDSFANFAYNGLIVSGGLILFAVSLFPYRRYLIEILGNIYKKKTG